MIKLLCHQKSSDQTWVCPEDLVAYWPNKPRHGFNTNTWINDITSWPGNARYFRVMDMTRNVASGYHVILSSTVGSFAKFEGLACTLTSVYQAVEQGILDFLLVFVHENFQDWEFENIPANLYKILDKFEITRENSITVVLGSKFITIQPDPKNRVRWMSYPWYAGIAQQQAKNNLGNQPPVISDHNIKPLTFLSMDGHTHYQKDLMLKLLEFHDVLQHGIYTRTMTPATASEWPQSCWDSVKHLHEFAAWLANHPELPVNKCVDNKDPYTGMKQRWVGTKLLYDKATWELIHESVNSNKEVFLSINTFRSMLMGMPFLINGGPGCLAWLRDQGFKTFGDIIDESYDSIIDMGARTNAVAQQIKFLCNLDHTQKQKMWNQLLPVLHHNQDLAWKQPHLQIFHDMIKSPNEQKSNTVTHPQES